MARRPLTILERVRLGLRWYGLIAISVMIGVAVVAWGANLWTTRADGDVVGKLGLTGITLAVILAFTWFFRVVNASRRQLLAGAEIVEDGDADTAER